MAWKLRTRGIVHSISTNALRETKTPTTAGEKASFILRGTIRTPLRRDED
jgi:hypothetical protein